MKYSSASLILACRESRARNRSLLESHLRVRACPCWMSHNLKLPLVMPVTTRIRTTAVICIVIRGRLVFVLQNTKRARRKRISGRFADVKDVSVLKSSFWRKQNKAHIRKSFLIIHLNSKHAFVQIWKCEAIIYTSSKWKYQSVFILLAYWRTCSQMRLFPGGCPLCTSREREKPFHSRPPKKRQKPSSHFSKASSSSIIISLHPDSPMLPRCSDSKRLRTYFHFFFFFFFIFNFLIYIQSSSFWTTGAPSTRAFGWDCCIVRRPTPTRSSPLGGGGESLTSRGGWEEGWWWSRSSSGGCCTDASIRAVSKVCFGRSRGGNNKAFYVSWFPVDDSSLHRNLPPVCRKWKGCSDSSSQEKIGKYFLLQLIHACNLYSII